MAALYGKLNMEMTPIRYKGKDTDTATVLVDNANKTISVNVKNAGYMDGEEIHLPHG